LAALAAGPRPRGGSHRRATPPPEDDRLLHQADTDYQADTDLVGDDHDQDHVDRDAPARTRPEPTRAH
jgi:hypothetical protein